MMRWLPALAAAALLLALPARATAQDDRFLERAVAYRVNGGTDIVISLTGPYRHVSHALSESGTVLQVRLLREGAEPAGAPGHAALRWGAAHAVPLDDVTAQVAGNIPSLILRFRVPVEVEAVRDDPDERTITVSLGSGLGEPPPAPVVLPPAASAAGIFVINLGSAAVPMAADRALTGAVSAPQRVYQTRSRPGGAARYRLQVGFFATEDDARTFLARLGKPYPDAWIGEVTTLERDAAQAGAATVDLAQLAVKSDSDPALPAASVERLAALMEEAGAAVAAADYERAAAVYGRVVQYPLQPYRRHAQELLGVVREKNGQLALAKSAYEAYLKRYPQGADADRVRQRLLGLASAGMRPRQRVAQDSGRAASWGLDLFGSFDQSFREDRFTVNDEPAETTRSLLNNSLDLNARRRGAGSDLRLRMTGSYDYSLIETADHQARATNAYLDFTTRDQQHALRAGRQTRGSGGVLGRFDGLYYGYRLGDRLRSNFVAGYPVELSSSTVDTTRTFYGVGLDIGPMANWSFNPYAVNQQAEGLVDRQAVGAELRYLSGGNSLFALADYDLHFAEPNILNLIGSAALFDATTVSLIADWRKSPLLRTGNALIGQTATTLEQLSQLYTESQLLELARDRTATSTSYTGSVSQAFGPRFRLAADVTSSAVSETPASGGVAAMPATGPDWYYGLQLIGSDLLRDSDLSVLGLRYLDATAYQGISASLDYRVRLFGSVKVNPRLRVDRRETEFGQTRWLYGPGLRASYARGPVTIELEAGSDLTTLNSAGVTTTEETQTDFYYLGYRYAF